MESSLYVAGPNLVTVHGLRHGDNDDKEEEVKRIGRRTWKRDEGRKKMRTTRKRRMRMTMRRIRMRSRRGVKNGKNGKYEERRDERQRTSGTATKATSSTVITRFTQNSQRKKVKYDATTDPKCDSISLMRSSQGTSTLTRLANSRFRNCHFWNKIGNKRCGDAVGRLQFILCFFHIIS
jgi:hypothetical protein